MKQILVVCSDYEKNSRTPSAKIMFKFLDYLSKHYPVDITVITTADADDEIDGIKTVYIPSQYEYFLRKRNELRNLLSKKNILLKLIARIKLRIINHNFDVNKYNFVIDKHQLQRWLNRNKKQKFDAIISIFAPYKDMNAVFLAKRKLKIQKFYPFIMEPWADHYSSNDLNRKERISEEKRIFETSKTIYCYKEFLTTSVYSPIKQYKDKVCFIPTNYLEIKQNSSHLINFDTIHCIYAGKFYHQIREPQNLLKIFKLLPNNYILHLYIRGDVGLIKKLSYELGARCVIHESVFDPKAFTEEMQKANVLISVGNSIANEVPSKIIEYMSFCKPIIHFINNKNDSVPKLFGDYPAILFIDYNAVCQETINKIEMFVDNVKKITVDGNLVKERFKEYTVESVVEKFYVNLIEDKNN